jgi:hypothetical protein
MKRTFLVGVFVFLAMVVSGCGGGNDHGPVLIVTDIVSAGGADDGDITFDGVNYSVFLSSQAPNTVVVNFGAVTETRGFITFDLATVPANASIQRATVFLPILHATPIGLNASVGLNVDMVTFPPLDTLATNLQRANVFNATTILQGPSFAVFPGDAGFDVTFDATGAVIEANTPPALSTLQFRLISSGGDVEIDDLFVPATGAGTPILRVEYF